MRLRFFLDFKLVFLMDDILFSACFLFYCDQMIIQVSKRMDLIDNPYAFVSFDEFVKV